MNILCAASIRFTTQTSEVLSPLMFLVVPTYAQMSTVNLYRVIHKSVKHFKNSQQIDHATDHGNSYVDRETVSSFF